MRSVPELPPCPTPRAARHSAHARSGVSTVPDGSGVGSFLLKGRSKWQWWRNRRGVSGERALEDLLVELARFAFWFDPQLALHDADADLVLAQRHTPTPLPRIEAHQRPVHGFLQRIELSNPRSDGIAARSDHAGRDAQASCRASTASSRRALAVVITNPQRLLLYADALEELAT